MNGTPAIEAADPPDPVAGPGPRTLVAHPPGARTPVARTPVAWTPGARPPDGQDARPEVAALEVYSQALAVGGRLGIRHSDGWVEQVDVAPWSAPADDVDLRMLDRCAGPTLDLGCGPGRLATALALRGRPCLGVDLSVRAVAMARRRGAAAIVRDLFAALPGEGRWACALLADGNIGIGGDPEMLLARVGAVLAGGGLALIEVCPSEVSRRGPVRLVDAHGVASRAFPWAQTGAGHLLATAARAGWSPVEQWDDGGRRFVGLASPR